ncbi:hypothetical protein DMX12_24920 [Pseudomonas sp. MB-090624]|nr:hypothetical protein DMX12_24920 [Pseudomonas sp. MB-090624]
MVGSQTQAVQRIVMGQLTDTAQALQHDHGAFHLQRHTRHWPCFGNDAQVQLWSRQAHIIQVV